MTKFIDQGLAVLNTISSVSLNQASEAGPGRDVETFNPDADSSHAGHTPAASSTSPHVLAGEGSSATSGGDTVVHTQATDAHSSDTHSSHGQDPPSSFPTQSDLTAHSDPPTTMTGTAISIAEKSSADPSGTLKDREKDVSTFSAPVGKRHRDGQSLFQMLSRRRS